MGLLIFKIFQSIFLKKFHFEKHGSISVPDCFQKCGGLKSGRGCRNFARKCSYITFYYISNRKYEDHRLSARLGDRKCFYLTFCQKRTETHLKTKFLSNFFMNLLLVFQKVLKISKVRQISNFEKTWRPSAPVIGNPGKYSHTCEELQEKFSSMFILNHF